MKPGVISLPGEIDDLDPRGASRPFADAGDAAVVGDGQMSVVVIAMRGLDAARERIARPA